MRSQIQQLVLAAALLQSADAAPAGLLDGLGVVTQLLALPTDYVSSLTGVLGTKPGSGVGAGVLNVGDLQTKLGSIWNTGSTGDFYGKLQKQIGQGLVPNNLLSSFQGLLGTGLLGSLDLTFSPNLLKLLTNVPYADPVWLNIPGALLGDAQVNSEYVAYAINYINGISNKNSSIISWSQGGLDTQWAFTFWPSTRNAVANFFPVSPDFHGTVLANVLCLSPGNGALNAPCDPSVIQQQYTSVFINTLRSRGGADAYVPTTTFYSAILDEVVEPQQGTVASAYLTDARRVGVTNIEVQSVCPGRPAGSIYGHATMLFNPLTAALIKDVLQRGAGPAKISNINLNDVCKDFIAPGLNLEDGIATAGSIVAAGIRLLAYLPKLIAEPTLMAYARS
ncbi:hypothetical protein HER10_EVM0009439 [Colletotrichum scovillei]|uniref:uncharacterized protein n=1 Tax=Colletotrichum scovillei TaxID=1209932 RepID=UPI0015C2F67E|nr:uncharacterized protein HER10_EVM0009439 [Colletotrichum scovillei]KAF4777894.1 hypothetical protein HER10_EVM0009439 [Colletotrichum scovillei]